MLILYTEPRDCVIHYVVRTCHHANRPEFLMKPSSALVSHEVHRRLPHTETQWA
jgi:hypothetical protein